MRVRSGDQGKQSAEAVHRRVMLGVVAWLVIATFSISGLPAAADDSGPSRPLGLQTETATPTESASPSASPSPGSTFDPAFRRVHLSVSRSRVRVGRRIGFSGRITANRPECRIDKPVTIRRKIFGTSKHLAVAAKRTDRNGEFRVGERAHWSAVYTAVAHRRAGCRREVSDPVVVYVSVRLGVRVTERYPERFTNFRIYGRLRPSHPRTKVLLQRRGRDRWVTVQRQELSPQSSYSFFPQATWRGKRVFRIKWPKADRDHETGHSRSITIKTT